MSLEGANDRDKLTSLCKKTFKEQAIWFLNADWPNNESKNAEDLWNYVHKCADLELQKKAAGCELDELNAHRFLEHFQNHHTVKALRDELRKVGVDNFKYIPLTMFLIWQYHFDWHKLVHAPQGSNAAEIAKATEMLESSQAACNEAVRLADEATASEKQAKAKATEAARREADAKATAAAAVASAKQAKARAEAAAIAKSEAEAAAEELRKADAEVSAALAELKAQEDAFNNKTEDLKRKSEEGSTVQKSKAANELAQHLSSDPLPLRKAKTTTEAAKRKAEKAKAKGEETEAKAKQAAVDAEAARHAADAAAAEAEADRKAAESARHAAESAATEAEAARQAAEDAVEEARRQVDEAEAYLEEQRAAGASAGAGTFWWLDRELQEQKKYMPQSKGGVRK